MRQPDDVRLIHWIEEPAFELVTADRMFNTFVCSKPGSVHLLGVGVIEYHEGWVTDITSSPWWGAWAVPQLGPHSPAALLHDRLLDMGFTRKVARKWLWRQLQQLPNVKKWRRCVIYLGVLYGDLTGRPLRRYGTTMVKSGS